jgi:hypothetical protein
MTLSASQLNAAREWVKDCLPSFRDLDDEESVDASSDEDIQRGLEKHYSGGVRQFLSDLDPLPVDSPAVSGCM